MKLNMLSKMLAAAIAVAGVHSVAYADMIGLYAGIDGWQHGGNLKISDAKVGLLQQAFDYQDKTDVNFSAKFEHPIPFIPNISARHTALNLSSTGNFTALTLDNKVLVGDIKLDGSNFVANDITAYYEVLDNVVSVDLGLTARQLKGDIIAKDALQTAQVSVNQIIPMGYAAAEVKLPFTGLNVQAQLSGVSYNGSSISDASAEIQYKFINNLAVDVSGKAGYRQLQIKLKDVDHINAETTIKGPYAGLEVHF